MAVARSYRRRIAWVAIVALLCNALTVFAPTKAVQFVDEILGPLVICTSEGAQAVSHDGGAPRPTHPNSTHCPSCTLVKHVIFVVAVPIAEFPSPSRDARKFACSPAVIAGHLRPGGIHSRAPPQLA